jgi:hypothetical protein
MEMPVVGFAATFFDTTKILALGPCLEEDPREGVRILRTGKQWQFPILGEGLCSAVQSETLVALWNSLPPGEQSRCHIPGFAFQLLHGQEAVFTAALCWRCNNVSFAGTLATLQRRHFDASSQVAEQLLALCREVVGNVS